MIDILEFHIHPETGDTYRLEVFARGDSQLLARANFTQPLSFLTQQAIDRLGFDPKDPAARLARQKEFGNALYQNLFTPDIERVWQARKNRSDFLVLCIRISPDAFALESLPWETLHDGNEFIAADTMTGMSRLPLDIKPQGELDAVPMPMKMLAFVASPLDLQPHQRLQIEREQEILLTAVNLPATQGRLHLDAEDEARLDILEGSLESGYHILHFTGHGIPPANDGRGGGLLLEDHQGKRLPASVAEVLQSLQRGEKSLRLVVLSGCQTARTLNVGGFRDLARGLARRNIPAVIAMQFSISDAAGLQLAELLYPRLLAGQPIEMAVSAMRRALLKSGNDYVQADALAPVLLCANGECLQITEAPMPAPQSQAIDFSLSTGNIPLLGFGFYGRRREYRRIRDALIHHNQRAVIIHGIGGMGKTTLAGHVIERWTRASRVYERSQKQFSGVHVFDCTSGTQSPERIVIELNQYFTLQGIQDLQPLAFQAIKPDTLAAFVAQVLNRRPLLLIFDNFESQLTRDGAEPRIADENLRLFLSALLKATSASKFIFTSRYRFDIDTLRLGKIEELSLDDLIWPEALGMMQKLPRLAESSVADKREAFDTFGGHPYAMVALDHYCGHHPLKDALRDAKALHAELREFLAIELNYGQLTDRARELLDRLSAFREFVPMAAVEWVMGEKVSLPAEFLQSLDRDKMPEEWNTLDDAALLEALSNALPERRVAANPDAPIKELIDWGLMMPTFEKGSLASLCAHNLVRDFCRDKQGEELWRTRLRDAAAYYTNLTKLTKEDDKTPAAVWGEMEAFELLMEAEDFTDAASLLNNATPLLHLWGFGYYLEAQYQRVMDKVDRSTFAGLIHNFGILLQSRGDYEAALDLYQRSLKIKEELGNRDGVASSQGQIGKLFTETERYAEAFERLLFALSAFIELQSPNAQIVARMLKTLRSKWGAEGFDAAWREATKTDVPEGLLD